MSRGIRMGVVVAAVIAAGAAVFVAAPAAQAAPLTCTDPRTGLALNVTVFGSAGDDAIWARTGDVIETFGGNDRVFSDYATNAVVCLDEGDDSFGPSAFLGTPTGSYGVRGGDGVDFIVGGTGNDGFFGGPGNDLLDGRTGTDTLNGAAGIDTCSNGEILIDCERRVPREGPCVPPASTAGGTVASLPRSIVDEADLAGLPGPDKSPHGATMAAARPAPGRGRRERS